MSIHVRPWDARDFEAALVARPDYRPTTKLDPMLAPTSAYLIDITHSRNVEITAANSYVILRSD